MLVALFLLPIAFLLFGIVVLEILPLVVILITSIYFFEKNSIEKSKRKDLLKAREEILRSKWEDKHGEM